MNVSFSGNSKEVPSQGILESIATLSNELFSLAETAASLKEKLSSQRAVRVQLAFDESDLLVGFKIGYEETKTRYYSWLGGVVSEHRNKGIAKHFIDEQHKWCKEQGYQTVRTKTKNCFRAMLILNLKMGFDVIGTYTDSWGEPKLILEKKL